MLAKDRRKVGIDMEIKGYEFGGKRPVVCVPVVEESSEEILKAIKNMSLARVEMIEWRMDWYQQAEDLEAVEKLLQEIACYTKKIVLLCTFRSKRQGGNREITRESYLALNRRIANTGIPDMVDLEYFEMGITSEVVAQFRETGTVTLCSHHDFQKTPGKEVMVQQLEAIITSGADFAKLAVMPQKKQDVLALMEAVLDTKEGYPHSHLIAMSMNGDGAISRLLGQWYGSEVTFGAFGKSSAPGQIPYRKADEILRCIEECI